MLAYSARNRSASIRILCNNPKGRRIEYVLVTLLLTLTYASLQC